MSTNLGYSIDGRILKSSRAKKTCSSCHARKTRCDVAQGGTPCSSCVSLDSICTIRTRKNARSKSSVVSGSRDSLKRSSRHDSSETSPTIAQNFDTRISRDPDALETDLASEISDIANKGSPSIESGSNVDFTTLYDFENIFDSTLNDFAAFEDGRSKPLFEISHGVQGGARSSDLSTGTTYAMALTSDIALDALTRQSLESHGCLSLPSDPVLRQLMELYFKYVHPNLPVVDENEIWALWSGGSFSLGNFSFLVLRCMLFISVHLLPPEILRLQLGFATKREARLTFYAQAKLLFSFTIERDPVAIARACLLLTYYAPKHNTLRVNSFWLSSAVHYAQIAGANAFPLLQKNEPERARVHKRLWWCLLFRDRILSLALRRPMMVDRQDFIFTEAHYLQDIDFFPEFGRSEVHDEITQNRLIETSTSMCRLVKVLSPVIQLLYRYERIDQRLVAAKLQPPSLLQQEIRDALAGLHIWQQQALRSFPSPLTLDLDEGFSGATSIFGNMLFIIHDSAVFALNQYRILLDETIHRLEAHTDSHRNAINAMETAISDMASRIQELLQARLAKYTPISASAFVALPLILQAINVGAAQNRFVHESIESRKLEVLTKFLEIQTLHFDGSDFIGNILTSIVDYTRSIKLLDDGRQHGEEEVRGQQGSCNLKPAAKWPELLRKKPRLLLRLLLKLDDTLCTGGIAGQDDYPEELR